MARAASFASSDLTADPNQALTRCAECGREVSEAVAISERWTYWSDGRGRASPVLPGCAARKFGVGKQEGPPKRAFQDALLARPI